MGVTITASGGIAEQAQYGGYITLTTGSGQVYRVPYAGLKGDYQSIVVVVPTSNGFPWLAKLSELLLEAVGRRDVHVRQR